MQSIMPLGSLPQEGSQKETAQKAPYLEKIQGLSAAFDPEYDDYDGMRKETQAIEDQRH